MTGNTGFVWKGKQNTKNVNMLLLWFYFPDQITIGDLLRDKELFISDVQQHMDFEPAVLQYLLEARLPNRNVEVSKDFLRMSPQVVYSVQASIWSYGVMQRIVAGIHIIQRYS